jgi:glycosyltransferase involved in cell wall biosynthesis
MIMKGVLFIGVTEYNPHELRPDLQKKFEGLARGMRIFVIARGRPFHKKAYNAFFYLIPYRVIFLPAAFFLGAYICVSKEISTIVCQGPLTEGVVGMILKFLFKKELIVEIHGDWEKGPFLNKKMPLALLLRKIVPPLGSLVLRNATKIRTLTHISSKAIRSRFPGKQYFVFPTFTDIDIFLHEKDTHAGRYIVTVAVLSPIKNIETLIDAFAQVHKEFPNFKLVIAGDGPSLESCRLLTIRYKLEGKIVFTGKLSLEEVKEAMKNCYMLALPSLSEGFGRVFIEAMALGKPVIGARVGGVPEIIKDGHNGFLVEPKDKDTLARKMKELIMHPDTAKRMGDAGRVFVEGNFSNEKYIKNYIDMINA